MVRSTTLTALLACVALAGCPSSTTNTPPAHPAQDLATQIDADPIALLPPMAAAVFSIDNRAFLSSGAGTTVGPLTDMLLPLGPETGFVASRDVDRITAGAYLLQGADVVSVVSGRFDVAHIDQAAQAHVATRAGGFLTPTQYGGRVIYVVSEAAFTILTPHTALAGTQTALRRAIDRIQGRAPQREVPKWMTDVLETQGASVALAADLTNQPVNQLVAFAPYMSGPWLNGLQTVRVLGDFRDPGVNVAGTLAYADPPRAQAAASSLRTVGAAAGFASALSSMVPQLRNLSIDVNGTSVQAKFAIDDQALRRVLQGVAQGRPAAPSPAPYPPAAPGTYPPPPGR